MTRIESIKQRLAAADRGEWEWETTYQMFVGDGIPVPVTTDLRDLLELYDAVKTMKPGYPWDNRVHAILARLDSPVGDEGAE